MWSYWCKQKLYLEVIKKASKNTHGLANFKIVCKNNAIRQAYFITIDAAKSIIKTICYRLPTFVIEIWAKLDFYKNKTAKYWQQTGHI
jgi:hypothetical protein